MSDINTRAYYKMVEMRTSVEVELNKYNLEEMREKARTLPKKSEERKTLNSKINEIIGSMEYKVLKTELDTINRCFNVAFYY